MTEPLPLPGDPSVPGAQVASPARSAGALLRAAREREGLHLAVLAATIKVAPAKLEALEQDRYDQLPNATFARALAQSICRSLKIDPRPVLALLPQVDTPALEGAMGKLNTPFQERPSRGDGSGLTWASKPMFWAGGLLLVAALVIGLVPPELLDPVRVAMFSPARPASAVVALSPAASPITTTPTTAGSGERAIAPTPSAATVSPSAVAVATPASDALPHPRGDASRQPAPVPGPTVAASAALPVAVGPGLLHLAASADSWIEVIDAKGQPVFSRIVRRDEAVAVDAAPPMRVRVGNASGTQVTFRGQVLELGPYTRDNVARLELR